MNATVQNRFRLAAFATVVALASACASTRTQQAPGEYVDDAAITAEVKTSLAESPSTKAYQVDVETFRGVVQLNGYVDSAMTRDSATSVARSVKGVKEVRNNLVVGEGRETVGEVVDDSVITSKVKTALIGDPIAKAGQINVTTENGVVQLAGFVDSEAEKSRAGDLARSVSGVRGVRNELDVKQAR